ncbi:hypothetical protein BT93_L0423 [Corymbia citriodora subsp. variegata]|uniref:Chitobiosyldiphosphodolichol beta-mannosyltransferase n=1 Tax=Corymbia citriodora subsp. variegata TaxID=360336 RepID=A0A8T0CIQ2_CORYI|nr:hypothetical protein BT93_L0423 [Corymbia citriodora subsp. variegata]
MLIQNPPSIPTLLIAIVVCYLRNTKLVVDWHNFGYTILALKLGDSHPLVSISRLYELTLAKYAYRHLTVTNAMRDVLIKDLHLGNVLPLHDRPASLFQPLSDNEKGIFLDRCAYTADEAVNIAQGRTRLIVSSTSWTADEDFSVLLDALCTYSAKAISDSPQLPELLVVITGRGPLKDYYLGQIDRAVKDQKLEMVKIRPAWLTFDDYARLLGSADLGVSLHTSSSGVDLPMKVVDMFGTGLPVLGYGNFIAWPELVQDGVNGKSFSNSEDMATAFVQLLDPADKELENLRQGALRESQRRWSSEWNPVAGRMFELID